MNYNLVEVSYSRNKERAASLKEYVKSLDNYGDVIYYIKNNRYEVLCYDKSKNLLFTKEVDTDCFLVLFKDEDSCKEFIEASAYYSDRWSDFSSLEFESETKKEIKEWVEKDIKEKEDNIKKIEVLLNFFNERGLGVK